LIVIVRQHGEDPMLIAHRRVSMEVVELLRNIGELP
jgi:hypothetical protein